MNLDPVPSSGFFGWVAKNNKAVADYCKAVFQLSKLTANLTSDGVTQKTVVTYTGRAAELNINLDWLALGSCTFAIPTVPIDGTDTPYVSEAIATAAMLDQVVDCLIETTAATTLTSLAAAVTGGALVVTDSLALPDSLVRSFVFGSIIKTAGGLQLDYVFNLDVHSFGDNVYAELYDDTWTLLETINEGASYSGTINFTTISADGTYYALFSAAQGPGAATTMSLSVTASSTKRITFCSITAPWDDGAGDTGEVTC